MTMQAAEGIGTAPFKHREALFLVWGPPSYGPRSEAFARELGIDVAFVFWVRRRGLASAPFKYGYQAVKTLALLARRRPKVVFIQSPPSLAVMFVALYCGLARAIFLVDAHSAAMLSPYWTRPRWLHAYLARRAAATIVTNEHFAEWIRGYGGRALVVPDIPTRFPTGGGFRVEGRFNVLVVNTFSPDEPLGAVIAAAKDLPDVTFYVSGDLKRSEGRLPEKVPDNVHFTGFLPRESFYGLMASCQAVMCLTTRDHTMQNGACEALSMARPIITSRWPLLQSYFSRGTVHVDNTAEAIAEGVREMTLNHPRYEAEIRQLQAKQQLVWKSATRALTQVVERSLRGTKPNDG
jgi:glycosyltransferase involved in cell wall biosynthesis